MSQERRVVELLLAPDLDDDVIDLLARAAGPGAGRLTDPYASGRARLIAGCDDVGVCGVIAYVPASPGELRLHAIATAQRVERMGVGRRLLLAAVTAEGASRVVAETDDEALGFYVACGFTVTPLGEVYPGVPRYRVEWTTP